MWAWTLIVASALRINDAKGNGYGVFCPDHGGPSTKWNGPDVGFNIWSNTRDNCFLRVSTMFNKHKNIDAEWIRPNDNVIVLIHGWQMAAPDVIEHYIPDQWGYEKTMHRCSSQANYGGVAHGGIEDCPPMDHDAKYWIEEGWNVLYADWKHFAHQPWVLRAEQYIHDNAMDGKTVPRLLFDKLHYILRHAGWVGEELRIAGNSLGAQVALSLSAEWMRTTRGYPEKLKRIALLDHFFSAGGQSYLPRIDPSTPCESEDWSYCSLSTGQVAVEQWMKTIRDRPDPPVIENYRTSALTNGWLLGIADENKALDQMTVFVQLKLWYYHDEDVAQKHTSAMYGYMHSMKFKGSKYAWQRLGAPYAWKDTGYVKKHCPIKSWNDHCPAYFVQKEDSGAYTTWESDDTFVYKLWSDAPPGFVEPGSGNPDEFVIVVTEEMAWQIIAFVGMAVAACVCGAVFYGNCNPRKRKMVSYAKVNVVDSDSEVHSLRI